MRLRACFALLLFLSACATTEPSPKEPLAWNPRFANLQRAATLPWRDNGQCVVHEASQPWPVVVERCFHALDTHRMRFRDTQRQCPVASADAASLETMVGICLLSQPEIAVGAVIVIGVVVVGTAIKEELDDYERRASRESARPAPPAQPSKQEPLTNRGPKPQASEDFFPPLPPQSRPRRPECEPVPGPPRGGNDPHNVCADKIPNNDFPGLNVFVNGKHFDALQLATRTLWEVKTDDFEKHSRRSQQFFIEMKLPEIRRERELAEACGYNFVVGVRSEAHKIALERADGRLNVVIMDWC